MLFQSTRSPHQVTGSQAILLGIAPDGGLYVPTELPAFDWLAYLESDYQTLATAILSQFFSEFSPSELAQAVAQAYRSFPETVVPIKVLGQTAVLELFHGPTLAFKDMALSLLPHLMRLSAKRQTQSDRITILTATSGDTGKAAMSGFAGVDQTEVIVFYPLGGVSPVQEQMMLTEAADNVVAFAIEGNFDDAQTGVKRLFQDPDFQADMKQQGRQLSSANSINIGRLVPQIVYYGYAYLDLIRQGLIQPGDELDVVVPTGNFGNILACLYAKDMGLPLGQIICASNQNHVLTDFINTGVYDQRRPLSLTSSPSMDILLSSNLERYLYHLNPQLVADKMTQLRTEGWFDWPEHLPLVADWADETAVSDTIYQVKQQYGEVLDPHTAVAWAVGQRQHSDRPLLVVATASPYKFPEKVLSSLGLDSVDPKELAEQSGQAIPKAISQLGSLPVRPVQTVTIDGMAQAVRRWLDD